MIIIVCGVSGAGKTTVGQRLASRLGYPFFDADDFHPPGNIEKMRRGEALDDADRSPWLDRLADIVAAEAQAVLACSALKQRHRDRLGIDGRRVIAVFLEGDRALIARRLAARKHAFMPASLLESQFEALEPPDGIRLSIDQPVDAICDEAIARFRAAGLMR